MRVCPGAFQYAVRTAYASAPPDSNNSTANFARFRGNAMYGFSNAVEGISNPSSSSTQVVGVVGIRHKF